MKCFHGGSLDAIAEAKSAHGWGIAFNDTILRNIEGINPPQLNMLGNLIVTDVFQRSQDNYCILAGQP